MNYSNTTRTTLIGATAAALLAATASIAVADNLAPVAPVDGTTAQPNQQETGVTAPGQVLTQSTSEQSTATKTEPTTTGPARVWTKRSERGTNTHARGSAN
jgi:hypothetical protein